MTPDLPAVRHPRACARGALLPLLAGGCLSMAPDYQRPAAPVPTTYEQAPRRRRRRPSAGATTTPTRSCKT